MSEATTTLTLPTDEDLQDAASMFDEAYRQLEQIVWRLAEHTNHGWTKDEPSPATLADVGRLLTFVHDVRELDLPQIADRLKTIEKVTLSDVVDLARHGVCESIPQLASPGGDGA